MKVGWGSQPAAHGCVRPLFRFLLGALVLFGWGPQYGVEARLVGGVKQSSNDTWTVCTSPWQPFVQCKLNSTKVTNFGGYSIEIFRQASLQVGWKPEEITFRCLDWLTMTADMLDPNGDCDMTSADFSYDGTSLDQGLQYAYPDSHGTFSILVYATSKTTSHWLFLQPFHWEVWLMLLLAAVVVGLSIHLVEIMSKKYTSRQIEFKMRVILGEGGWFDSAWKGLGLIVNAVDPISAATVASRLVVFVWCFMILLLLTMYTGNAAAILTARNWSARINSRSDLVGANFGASAGGIESLSRLGLFPTKTYLWRDDQDSQYFLEELRLGYVDALVLDSAFVESTAATNCDFHEVDVAFGGQNYAMTFNPSLPSTLVGNFSRAVLNMEKAGTLDRLRQTFLVPLSTCQSGTSSSTDGVTFEQVSGLWIVLAGTIGFAMVFAYLKSVVNKRQRIRSLRAVPISRSLRKRGRMQAPASSTEVLEVGDQAGNGVVLTINPLAEDSGNDKVTEPKDVEAGS